MCVALPPTHEGRELQFWPGLHGPYALLSFSFSAFMPLCSLLFVYGPGTVGPWTRRMMGKVYFPIILTVWGLPGPPVRP